MINAKTLFPKLLFGTAILALTPSISFAQCVTTGNINADCTLSSSSTGAVTIGNVGTGVTVTIDSDITLGHTFDDDDATADGNLATDGSGVTITQSADIGTTNPFTSLTVGATDVWNASANITTGTLNLGAGSTLTQSGATNLYADINGSTGVDTITKSGAGNLGQAGDTISLGADDDRINLNAAITVGADSIDGGAGTDAIVISGGDVILNSDVTNIETVSIISGNQLTVGGSITDSTINMSTGGSTLVVNAAGETISGTVQARDGFLDTQVVTLTDGNLSADINLGDANDTLNLNGGTYTGNVDLGSEDDTLNLAITPSGTLSGGTGADTMNITGAAVTTGGAVSGFETIDVGGNTLTVEHAVSGLDTADNAGLDVNSGTLNVNDGGSIAGAIHSTGGSGTGAVEFGQDTNGGTFNIGGIIEDIDLTVTSGTVNTNGNALGANSSLGNVTTAAAGTLNISDDVTSGGNLTSAGTTQINAGATLTVNDHVASGGTLTFGVDSGSGAGSLVVTAGDVDFTGATITASVASGGSVSDGAEFLIADGTTQVNGGTGQTATIVTDNSFMWNFTLADGSQTEVTTGGADNTEMYLITSMANTIAQVSNNSNNANVGDIVLALSGTSNTQLQTIVNNFNSASSQQEVNDIFEALQPTIDGGHVVGAFNVSHKSLDLARVRLASLRSGQTGMSAGDGVYTSNVWARGFGQMSEQDRRDGIDGYEADTYGFAVGIDNDVTDHLRLGIAFSYADTEVDSKNINRTNTAINSYQGTIYGDYDVSDITYINGMLGYTYGTNDTTRYDVGGVSGLNANADFDSSQFSAQLEVGMDIANINDVTVTPHALVNYLHYNADSYTETGAGGANLSVENDNLNMLELGVGIDAAMQVRNIYKSTVLEPSVRAGYRYDVIGDTVATTSRFTGGGATFKTEGFDPAQSTLNLGSSLSYYKEGEWSLAIGYDYEVKKDYDAHSGSLQVKKAF